MSLAPRAWTTGRHTLRFEPPDLLWSKFRGSCTRAEAIQMVEIYREVGSVQPFYMLADMEEAEGMESEARRYMSDHIQHEWVLGIIYFKSRLLHRAIAMGMLLAAEMTRMDKSHLRGKIHFVSTEAKAQELLAQLRAQQGGGHG